MKDLLKIEWLKLKHYGAFKIIFLLFTVGVFLTNYIVLSVSGNVEKKVQGASMLADFNLYNFYNTWQTTSYVTGYLLIIPAMLLIIITTNEYTFKTNRQNIIDGWSRQEFIKVKLVLAFILAVICTVLVIISALLFAAFSGTEFSLNEFSHVGYFFLKALSYNLLAILVSVALKRTGFAIGLYFIYLGAENLLSQMLDFWSLRLKGDGIDLGSLGDYLPMNAADGLLTFPKNSIKSMAAGILPTNYFFVVLAFAIFYMLLFVWLSHKKYTTADL